jgi:hypothetical protein
MRPRGAPWKWIYSNLLPAALIDYYTSYDIMPGDSFVGYAGIVLEG